MSAERIGNVRVVAEAAEGYAADWEKELALVELAAEAGATAVKFQLLHPDELLVPSHPLYELVAGLQLSPERWRAVAERAGEHEVELLLDVFGRKGLELAESLAVAAVKVHSSDMLNESLLGEIGSSSVPEVLLSAGGTSLDEVEEAITRLPGKAVTVILGFQAYPTPVAENGLLRLQALRERFPAAAVGFADHTGKDEPVGAWLPALALALGASYVEKHITVAQVLRDPDHQSALAPDEFAEFVANMRLALAALGESPQEGAGAAEQAYRLRMKKHVVAARDLRPGTPVEAGDLVLKRVSEPPDDVLFRLGDAIGRVLEAEVAANAPLRRGQLR